MFSADAISEPQQWNQINQLKWILIVKRTHFVLKTSFKKKKKSNPRQFYENLHINKLYKYLTDSCLQ